jgi:hypothetical protein
MSLGIALRAARIDDHSLWVDEAESSINGLTILQHGLPLDHYLGLPIYENSLLEPWPESREYEFKDLSYSDRGVAVYHAWLPLYSIALSQWLFGIEPDQADAPIEIRDDYAEMLRRTWAPRIPSVVYSGLFVWMMYLTARTIAGEPAGWAALVFSAFSERLVWFGSQARYYSATLAMDALCAWALWQCIARGRWRDFVIFAVALVLLFYTHTLSCAAVIVTAFCVLPLMWRHDAVMRKAALAGGIFAAITGPWIWLSGLANHTDRLPKSRELLVWPDDVLEFLSHRPESVALLTACAALLAVRFVRTRTSDPVTAAAARDSIRGALMMGIWLFVAYASFFLLMPAASFFWMRMTMTLEVPGILLVAIGLAGMTSSLTTRVASGLAATVVLAFLVLSGRLAHAPQPVRGIFADIRPVVDHLRRAPLSPETRIYASPNSHLVWTYYLGVPVQSIAPVRAQFLNTYPGPILFVERFGLKWLTRARLIAETKAQGITLDDPRCRDWLDALQAKLYIELIQPTVASVEWNDRLPTYLDPILDRMRQVRDGRSSSDPIVADCPLMMRHFRIATHRDWWQTFFYRFVDPRSRSGDNANFATRFRTADVTVLAGQTAVFHVPPLNR